MSEQQLKEVLDKVTEILGPLTETGKVSVLTTYFVLWADTLDRALQNTEHYRSLLLRIGNSIGKPARTVDGEEQDEIILDKLPQLVDDIICGRLK